MDTRRSKRQFAPDTCGVDFDLEFAVRRRDRATVRRLLAYGVERASLDEALSAAAEVAPPAIVRDLLAAGADPEARDFVGFTALLQASGRRQSRVVRVLLEHGAEVNARSGAWLNGAPALLRTPLMVATTSGDLRTVLLLLRAGADPDAADEIGMTALHRAAYSAAPPLVVEALLNHGAAVDPRDTLGRTPLMLAAWQGALAAAEVLVMRGAQLNLRDGEGFTPWMWAVKWGHPAVARMLVEIGAVLESQPVWVVPEEIRRRLLRR